MLKSNRFFLIFIKYMTNDSAHGRLKAYCSHLVPIEILGSLARVDPEIAAGAILAFFSFPIEMIPLTERVIREASKITLETGATHDAVHAAAMKNEGLETIITEDIDHWSRIEGLKIIRPLEYN